MIPMSYTCDGLGANEKRRPSLFCSVSGIDIASTIHK
jgi:hypothetical protein